MELIICPGTLDLPASDHNIAKWLTALELYVDEFGSASICFAKGAATPKFSPRNTFFLVMAARLAGNRIVSDLPNCHFLPSHVTQQLKPNLCTYERTLANKSVHICFGGS